MKPGFIKLFVPFLAVIFFSSCAYQREPLYTPERFMAREGIKSAAVLPFIVVDGVKDGKVVKTGEIFSSELARFREISVIHPNTVKGFLDKNRIVLNEKNISEVAKRVGEFFNVDIVIAGTVTEYNPFFPPVLGISIAVFRIDRFSLAETKSEVYDAGFNFVRNEVKSYASYRNLGDTLYGSDIILQKAELYIRFVCHQIIKKYL